MMRRRGRPYAAAHGRRVFILFFLAVGAAFGTPPEWRVIGVESRSFVSLRDLAAIYGMRMTQLAENRIQIANASQSLRFKTNSRETFVYGTQVWLNAPLTLVRGHWAVDHVDVTRLLDPILRPQLYLRSYRAAVVLIDPGHGGKDTGAISPSGTLEKDLTLDIARRLRTALANAGIRALLTRENDRFVELGARSAMIARIRADVFVSIHLNSASDTNARGVETYILPAQGFQSTHAGGGPSGMTTALNGHRHAAANAVLAHTIQRYLRQQTGLPDRGLRQAHYAVLKDATCPAALVECGFLSNPQDEAFLRSPIGRERIAVAIAQGILAYARAIASTQPPSAPPPATFRPPSAPPPPAPVSPPVDNPSLPTPTPVPAPSSPGASMEIPSEELPRLVL